MRSTGLGAIAAWVFVCASSATADPKPNGTWSLAYQTGVMTNGRAAETLNPNSIEFVDNYLLGFVLGYDHRITNSRFSIGAELQTNLHFGNQELFEIVLPVSIRYHPENSWWDAFDSFAFGLGYSLYSEVSELESSNYEEGSRRNLIYWYLEVEFAELTSDTNLFARLHHRSNGFDAVKPNGGSNAIIVGLRHDF